METKQLGDKLLSNLRELSKSANGWGDIHMNKSADKHTILAALAPSDAAQGLQGSKLVPTKPIRAMLAAGVDAAVSCTSAKGWCPPLRDGMLDAAPVAPAAAASAECFDLRFPTMLRKMWSGSEQAWLDDLPPLYGVPTHVRDGKNGNASLIEGSETAEQTQSTLSADGAAGRVATRAAQDGMQ
ncbi:hypothetical protein [Paraburkholderia sp. JHI869]|uniref:hypothetical protein n=1 Tax=Paraburkholderia sp. JHI869 TaxID=3112959 RepID=UPI003171B1B7